MGFFFSSTPAEDEPLEPEVQEPVDHGSLLSFFYTSSPPTQPQRQKPPPPKTTTPSPNKKGGGGANDKRNSGGGGRGGAGNSQITCQQKVAAKVYELQELFNLTVSRASDAVSDIITGGAPSSQGGKRQVKSSAASFRIFLLGVIFLSGIAAWLWRLTDLILIDNHHDMSIYHSLASVLDPSRLCPNPEKDTTFPFDNDVCEEKELEDKIFTEDPARIMIGRSKSSTLSCNLCAQSEFTQYLGRLSKIAKGFLKDQCSVIIYSVKFGKMNKALWKRFNLTSQQNSQNKNNCLMLFMRGEDAKERIESGDFQAAVPGSDEYLLVSKSEPWSLRVPVPQRILPYKNNRRNVKLIKFHGYQIFPWADKVMWIDGKFRQELNYNTFERYFKETIEDPDVCASFVGLPSDLATMGPDFSRFAAPTFRGHCQAIIAATHGRPTVTDSTEAIEQQCEDYLRKVQNHDEKKIEMMKGYTLIWSSSLSSLDYGMIDSAVIAWNMKEKRCRQFMADLSCTWADQVKCYADRDQVSFPYSLSSMGLRVDSGDGIHTNIIWKDKTNETVVNIVPSTCHWYLSPTFDCVHNRTLNHTGEDVALDSLRNLEIGSKRLSCTFV